jgi:lysyl-tRNA synthetase class 2
MNSSEIPLHDQRDVRLLKLDKIRAQGINPYPERFERTHTIAQATATPEGTEVATAGRLVLIRVIGKLTFAHIQDFGGKIQIALSKNEIGVEKYKWFLDHFDIADFIGVKGKLIRTKTGELTIDVAQYAFLGKALHPLPEKWHGLRDVEACYRRRYLDLIMNENTRKRFTLRTRIARVIREFLDREGFLEVETPILQTKPSGARAKPFVTHHNALNIPMYMRIAPETYLKRLVVGGYDKVYEFGRCFRNEGMDPSHVQDFTMIEYYCAYWNYQDNMDFTEKFIKHVLVQALGTLNITYAGTEINFDGAWPRISMRDLILKDSGIDIDRFDTSESLRAEIKKKGIEVEDIDRLSRGPLIDSLYKKVSRPKIIQPMFLTAHPIDLSPLARRNDRRPGITDRFQLVVNGWEIVNAYSELVDPIDQRVRFEEQARLLAGGDEEAMPMDEDYLLCMEHGMPPISGWGLGFDRLVALLTNSENLRDVILFPLMRPLTSETRYEEESTEEKLQTAPAKEAAAKFTTDVQDLGISREKAFELFNEHVKDEILRKHSLAAAAVMKGLAKELGKNEEVWELAGLLHDLDFDRVKEPERHGLETAEILRKAGVNPKVIDAILAHNAEGLAPHGVKRVTDLDFALTAAESITGLVVATALVQPDKKLASVKAESLLKKMEKKDFARKVSREAIMFSKNIGLELERFAFIALKAMQTISFDLGL